MKNASQSNQFILPSIDNLESSYDIGNPIISSVTHNGASHPLSYFNDNVWDLRPIFLRESAPDSIKKLNWDTYPFNNILYKDLTTKAKLFIYSLWSDPIEHLKFPKSATLRKKFNSIKSLCTWLANSNYFDFSNEKSFYEYSAYLKTTGNSEQTRDMKLTVIRELYHQSCKIPLIGVHRLPWDGDDPMATEKREQNRSEIRYIPDTVAQAIISQVITFIEKKGPHIIEGVRATKEAQNIAKAKKMHPDNISRERGKAAKRYDFEGTKDLNEQERILRDCCYICILNFSGMRQSEVLSIKINSIRIENHPNGEMVNWLDATLYKTSGNENGEPASWIVPDIVITATATLEKLREIYVDDINAYLHFLEEEILAGTNVSENRIKHQKASNSFLNLFVTYDSASNSWGTVTGKTMDKYLKIFCKDHNIDHTLSSHQFRHTFARMVARHKLGDLHYLRVHFKHWSQDMTNHYAGVASNNDIFDEISVETLRHKETIIHSLLESSEELFGKRGESLREFRGTIINGESIEIIAKSLAKDTYIRGNGHSWCISSPGKQCSGICVYDRTLCVKCDNAVIEKHRHLPVWHELKDQLHSTMKMTEVDSPARARAEKQLASIEKLIRRMSQ